MKQYAQGTEIVETIVDHMLETLDFDDDFLEEYADDIHTLVYDIVQRGMSDIEMDVEEELLDFSEVAMLKKHGANQPDDADFT